MPRSTAPPPLPGPGFFPHGACARRPPPAGFAARSQPSCPLPSPPPHRSSPRQCARASSLLLLPPPPSGLGLGEPGPAASAGSRAPRRCPPSPDWLRPTPPSSVSLGDASPRGPSLALPAHLAAPPQLLSSRLGLFKWRRPPSRRLEPTDWPSVSIALQGFPPLCLLSQKGWRDEIVGAVGMSSNTVWV